MSATGLRRSDRVCLTLLLEVSGTDSEGHPFHDAARTMLISRHGAVILLNRNLSPEQQLHLQRTAESESHRKGMTRVVGQFGQQAEGYLYGVETLDNSVDLWGVEFPPLNESEEAVARMLLECSYCRAREVVYLNELELKGFEASRGIARHCKACGLPSIWVQAPHEEPKTSAVASGSGHAESAASSAHTPASDSAAERRKSLRLKTRLTACIRHAQADDELAVCEEISSEGLCFRSRRRYDPNSKIDVAVPYAHASANIFVPARIIHVEEIPTAGLFRHGTEYIRRAQQARVEPS
jgi:hypothetical protein